MFVWRDEADSTFAKASCRRRRFLQGADLLPVSCDQQDFAAFRGETWEIESDNRSARRGGRDQGRCVHMHERLVKIPLTDVLAADTTSKTMPFSETLLPPHANESIYSLFQCYHIRVIREETSPSSSASLHGLKLVSI